MAVTYPLLKPIILLSLALQLLNGVAAGETDSVPFPVIHVEASNIIGDVNRKIFGQNLETADGRGIFSEAWNAKIFDISGIRYGQGIWNPDRHNFRPEIIDIVKGMGVGMLRYPGGCLAHNYDWRKAVGPLKTRGDWQFGIDEFILLCRELGADPIITVSDYVLPAEEMPTHAADLVEYLNSPATPEHPWALKRKKWGHPQPYGVKWFELGNESCHGNHKCEIHRCYTPQQYVDYANACIKAMRAIDSSIRIGVITQPGAGNDYDCAWNETVFKGAGNNADFLVVHFYGPKISGDDAENNFKSCMAYSEQLERYMQLYREYCKKYSGKDLPLAVTEYNIGFSANKPMQWRFTHTAGLLCADLTRLFMKPQNNVINAEYWQLLNGWWGFFRAQDGHITKKWATLPFYQIMGEHTGDKLINVFVSDAPRYAAPAAGGMLKAEGGDWLYPKKIGKVSGVKFNFNNIIKAGIELKDSAPSSFSLKFKNFNMVSYLELLHLPRKMNVQQYRISFQARFIPENEKPDATLGLSLLDARGWNTTKSGIAVDYIERSSEWSNYSSIYAIKPDCSGINLLLRVPAIRKPINGVLEVKNLVIEEWSEGHAPAYEGLTVMGSLSVDTQTLHLAIFNKSYNQNIKAGLKLIDFKALSASAWTVRQKDIKSVEYKSASKFVVKMPQNGTDLQLSFPAHSMTVIDFIRK